MKPAGVTLAIVGLILVALGVFLGTLQVTRLSNDCGTGFGGLNSRIADKDAAYYDRKDQDQTEDALLDALKGEAESDQPDIPRHRLATACQGPVDSQRNIALVVTIPGAALAVAGLVLLMVSGGQRSGAAAEE